MVNEVIRLILNGPATAHGAILRLSAYNIRPLIGDVMDLAEHLLAGNEPDVPGWRTYADYGQFFIQGERDLDVTPYLQQLAMWLDKQRFASKIVAMDPTEERLAQIRGVFPGAIIMSLK